MRKLTLILLIFCACNKAEYFGEGVNPVDRVTYEFKGTGEAYKVIVELNDFRTLDTVVKKEFVHTFSHAGKRYHLIYIKDLSGRNSYIFAKISRNGKQIATKSGYCSTMQLNNEVEYKCQR